MMDMMDNKWLSEKKSEVKWVEVEGRIRLINGIVFTNHSQSHLCIESFWLWKVFSTSMIEWDFEQVISD